MLKIAEIVNKFLIPPFHIMSQIMETNNESSLLVYRSTRDSSDAAD